MASKKRKIGFYYLVLSRNDDNIGLQDAMNNTLEFINALDRANRRLTLSGNKFGLLDNSNSNGSGFKRKLTFKSATHSFRPNLIDKSTAVERDSPKTIDEGEIQKTHLIAKAINGDIIIALERHSQGMSIKYIVNYLNHFAAELQSNWNFRFSYETILKDDFLEEVNGLTRVVSAEIHVDKQVLGGAALNFSDRINTVSHEVVVSVKAKRMDSIKDFSRDVYALLNGGRQSVNKITLIGRNNENNEIRVNTELIERQEYIDTNVNKITGEIDTSELFIELDSVLNNYN